MEKFKKGDRVKFDYHFDLGIGTICECIGTLNEENIYIVVFDKTNKYWYCKEEYLELVSNKITKVKIVNWRQK